MKEIEITFIKTGYLSPREPISVILPTKWEEVTEEQIIDIVGIFKNELTLKAMLNTFTGLNIGIEEELSNKSSAEARSILDKLAESFTYSNFIIKEFRGQRVFNPFIMNHSLEAVSLGVLYHKLALNNKNGDLSNLLKLTACFYFDKGFRKENIDCFFTLFDEKANLARLLAINFNFALIYNWLKERYPYACRLVDTDVQTNDKLDWFQFAYLQNPVFYSAYSLTDSMKKINLSIKEYINNGIKSAKLLEKLLYTGKN